MLRRRKNNSRASVGPQQQVPREAPPPMGPAVTSRLTQSPSSVTSHTVLHQTSFFLVHKKYLCRGLPLHALHVCSVFLKKCTIKVIFLPPPTQQRHLFFLLYLNYIPSSSLVERELWMSTLFEWAILNRVLLSKAPFQNALQVSQFRSTLIDV